MDSQGEQWTDVYFTPVACFLVFNVGDYIGRALSTTISWPKIPSQAAVPMMVAAFARIAFIPLFLFCNACPSNRVVSDVSFKKEEKKYLTQQNRKSDSGSMFQVYIKSDAASIRLEEVNYLEKGTLVWQIIGESDQSGKIIRRKLAQRCQIIIVPNASFRPDNQY